MSQQFGLVLQLASDTVEVAVLPRMTPSRMPLLTQRWASIPPDAGNIRLVEGGTRFPEGTQTGVRWSHTVRVPLEFAVSYFDGFNTLLRSNIEVHCAVRSGRDRLDPRVYPRDRRVWGGSSAPYAVVHR